MAAEDKDPLDELMDRRGSAPPPDDIDRVVWRRIALLQRTEARPGLWPTLDAWFSRWSVATLFLVSCALIGLFMAELRVSQRERERNIQLTRSYLVLINPLLQAPGARPTP